MKLKEKQVPSDPVCRGGHHSRPIPRTPRQREERARVRDKGPHRGAPVPDDGPHRSAPLPDDGPHRSAPVPDDGPHRSAPLPDDGPHRSAPVREAHRRGRPGGAANITLTRPGPPPRVGCMHHGSSGSTPFRIPDAPRSAKEPPCRGC
ncbi:hypothetical protein AB0919_31530 [Streptomyces sp. NPDC046994]|uniref:hypothetical protein n=1 Tax=Streptomyces sp. NPDC046994 TaxID=3155735 RepID=UPI0034540A02